MIKEANILQFYYFTFPNLSVYYFAGCSMKRSLNLIIEDISHLDLKAGADSLHF